MAPPTIRLNIHNSQVYVYNIPDNYDYNQQNTQQNTQQNRNVENESPTIERRQSLGRTTSDPVLNRVVPNISTRPFGISPTRIFLTPTILNERNRSISETINSLERTTRSWLDILNMNNAQREVQPEVQSEVQSEIQPEVQPEVQDSSGSSNLNDLASIFQQAFQIPVEQFHIELTERSNTGTPVSRLLSGSSLMLVSPEDVGSEENTCAICQNQYNESDILRKLNSCGHYFHASCLEEWFSNHSNCPVCRSQL